MTVPDLTALALSGAEFAIRVTPRARGGDRLEMTATGYAARVGVPPEDGKANAAVQQMLARALGVAPSRLRLLRGATSRAKLFRLD